MTDNKTEKDVEPPKYKSSELTLSETESFNTKNIEITFPTRNIESEIKQYYSLLNKVSTNDNIVTVKDMRDNSGNLMLIKLDHQFGNNYSTIKILGEKPIIWEHSESYIESEIKNESIIEEFGLNTPDMIIWYAFMSLILLTVIFRNKIFKKK